MQLDNLFFLVHCKSIKTFNDNMAVSLNIGQTTILKLIKSASDVSTMKIRNFSCKTRLVDRARPKKKKSTKQR